jgi:Co/Zn/Cd efflux system component
MKVEIVRNSDDNVVGYKLIRESIEELETIERIRDMHFWGTEDNAIKYNGRLSEENTDDTLELRFTKKKYINKD